MTKRRFRIKKAVLRGFLYISIASLTALMSDLSGFKNFSEITQVGVAIIFINFILQGFIADVISIALKCSEYYEFRITMFKEFNIPYQIRLELN